MPPLEWDPLPPRPPRKFGGQKPPRKGGSGKPRGSLLVAAVAFACLPFGIVAGVAVWLLHGYGVI